MSSPILHPVKGERVRLRLKPAVAAQLKPRARALLETLRWFHANGLLLDIRQDDGGFHVRLGVPKPTASAPAKSAADEVPMNPS